MRKWHRLATDWLDKGAREVFVYFDNDQAGYAALNARELREMTEEQKQAA